MGKMYPLHRKEELARITVMTSTEIFLARHGGTLFRHSKELLSDLQSGACRFHSCDEEQPLSRCSHYLKIYRFRAEWVRQFSSAHARSLLEDTEQLCNELAIHPASLCVTWTFTGQHYAYSIFEESHTHRLLGCIKSVDRRMVSPEAWDRLWGNPVPSRRWWQFWKANPR
jgi:hypothetical protein